MQRRILLVLPGLIGLVAGCGAGSSEPGGPATAAAAPAATASVDLATSGNPRTSPAQSAYVGAAPNAPPAQADPFP
jgi:hypothetical protein